MFKSLYSKLAAVLTALFLLVGLTFLVVTLFSTDMYQQEVNQKLNSHLAEQIVKEKLLMSGQNVNQDALKEIFHMLMVVNPSIEIYLLDIRGNILAYSAEPGAVKRTRIDLSPVRICLDQESRCRFWETIRGTLRGRRFFQQHVSLKKEKGSYRATSMLFSVVRYMMVWRRS